MRIRVCWYKNAGVAGYAEAFRPVQSDSQTSEWYSYFENDVLDIQIIRNGSAAELQGVFIIPVYMSKGLEFDAVLICDADNQNYYDEDDKNLLYVACTRALHRLSLFCEKEVSPLIYATSKHTKLAQTE